MSKSKLLSSSLVGLQNEYLHSVAALNGDAQGRLATMQSLAGSTAVYHNELIGMGFIPKLYDVAALDFFADVAQKTYTIISKLTTDYQHNPSYRRLFGFSPLLERLIRLPSGYECTVPIARIDLFLDEQEGDFWFCEFNTDGSSAMNEERAVCDAIAQSSSFERFSERHSVRPQELFEPWVEQFGAIYAEFANNRGLLGERASNPSIAIVDYTQSATISEFEEFRTRFERAGYRCIICDIASLRYQDGVLYGNDVCPTHPAASTPTRIDAVYRRAVTSEIMAELDGAGEAANDALVVHLDTILAAKQDACNSDVELPSASGARALVHAYAMQAICMIGGFMTQVAHSKQFAVAAHHGLSQAILNPEERDFVAKHFPFTAALRAGDVDIEALKASKDTWIIKPEDGYGSVGVFAGLDMSQESWERELDAHIDGHYVVQTYCPQYKTLNDRPLPVDAANNPLFTSADEVAAALANGSFDPNGLKDYNNLTGLFIYGGKLAGIYVRAGQGGVIVGFNGGVTLGSFIVDSTAPTPSGIKLR